MPKFLRISIAVFLALATTVGSGGLTLHKMACFNSGYIVLSVNGDFDCNHTEEGYDGQMLVAVCCNFDQLDFSVSAFDYQQKLDFQFLLPSATVSTQALPETHHLNKSALYEKLIPPLPQHRRLAQFGTYII